MTALRRFVYLGYYLRRRPVDHTHRFMRYVKERHGVGHVLQALNVVNDSLRYNISPLEWYQFGFHSLDPQPRHRGRVPARCTNSSCWPIRSKCEMF